MKKIRYIASVILFFVSCAKKNLPTYSSSTTDVRVPDEYVGIWIINNQNYSFLQIEQNGNFSIRAMSEVYKGIVGIEENKIVLPYSEQLYCGAVGEFENTEEINLVRRRSNLSN